MRHSSSRTLFSYWNDLRGARSAPDRQKVDPAAIREIVSDTFLLEVDLAGGFPVRMSGTRVDALLGHPQNGRRFLDLWPKADAHAVAAMLLTVADGVCPVVAGATALTADYAPNAVELLLLPLRHHGRTHSRILGAMTPVARPRWFGLVPVSELRVDSFRVIDADNYPRGVLPAPEPARRHRHLSIYEGGVPA